MKKAQIINNGRLHRFWLGGVISRFYFKVGRDKAYPEKRVLPTILFINTNHEAFTDVRRRGFMLCFGWWDFAVKFGMFL